MGLKKEQEKEYAKLLYIKEGLTQKAIAEKIDVTEKTISKWVSDGKWADLKKSLVSTRTSVALSLQTQLDLLQQAIGKREDQLGTQRELDTMAKLATAIKKLESDANIGDTINVAMGFCQFVSQTEPSIHKDVTRLFDTYIKTLM